MANQAANLANLIYGRDKKGIENAKNNVENNYQKLCRVLSKDNAQYQNLINTIDKNWVGADADKYKQELEKDIADLKAVLGVVRTKLQIILDNAYNEFVSFQAKN